MSKHPFALSAWVALCGMLVAGPLCAAGDQVQVIPDSQFSQWWQDPPGSVNREPELPIEVARAGVEGCVAVAFEVRSDGSVSNERIWKSALTESSVTKPFEQIILRGVHQWRFVPAASNGARVPVYTFRVLSYSIILIPAMTVVDIPTHAERERENRKDETLRAKCEMTDFPQQVQAMINSGQTGKSQ